MRALALALAAAACSSSAPRRIDDSPAAEPDPHSYELGLGVPRDYRHAAAIYGERCADGCGDLASCRRLFDLVTAGRGRTPTVEDVGTLMRMCNRGDAVGCDAAALIGLGNLVHPPQPMPDCASGDAAACETELWSLDSISFGPYDDMDSTPEERDQKARAHAEDRLTGIVSRLCRGGMLAACLEIVDNELARCTSDGSTCVTERTARLEQWGLDPAPLHAAWFATTSACGRGDADACARIPGHAIDPHVLCDAGDFGQCDTLANGGDRHAAALACEAGMRQHCDPPGPKTGTAADLIARMQPAAAGCTPANTDPICAVVRRLVSRSICPAPTR